MIGFVARSEKMDIDLLRSEVADKLAQLLKNDVAGWYEAARRIDSRAGEHGFDLAANFDSAQSFAESFMDGMRFDADLEQRFPNGVADFEHYGIAEELFWQLMPPGILSRD
jgi:hypothetical protein